MSAPDTHIFKMLMDLYKSGYDQGFNRGLEVANEAAQKAIQEYFGAKAPEGGRSGGNGGMHDTVPAPLAESPKDWFSLIRRREDRKANYTKFKKRLSLVLGGQS